MLTLLQSMLPMHDTVRRSSESDQGERRRSSPDADTDPITDGTAFTGIAFAPPPASLEEPTSLPPSPPSRAERENMFSPPPLQLIVSYSVKRPSQSMYYRGLVRRANSGAFAKSFIPARGRPVF